MSQEMDKNERVRRLLAYADDELQGQDKIGALEQLAADPQAARAVIHQTQLRDAVKRTMQSSAPSLPQSLHDQIAQLAADDASAEPIARITPATPSPMSRWAPALAAAVLLVASVVILNMVKNQAPSVSPDAGRSFTGAPLHAAADLLTVPEVQRFSSRHIDCSTDLQKLHDADWPTQISELPVALEGYLGAATYKGLDLAAAGYRFAGAGPCKLVGEPSAHLIYQPTDGDVGDSISLWLRPDDGRFDISENNTYQVTTAGSAHPVLIWRRQGIIYYLVGKSTEQITTAHAQFSP